MASHSRIGQYVQLQTTPIIVRANPLRCPRPTRRRRWCSANSLPRPLCPSPPRCCSRSLPHPFPVPPLTVHVALASPEPAAVVGGPLLPPPSHPPAPPPPLAARIVRRGTATALPPERCGRVCRRRRGEWARCACQRHRARRSPSPTFPHTCPLLPTTPPLTPPHPAPHRRRHAVPTTCGQPSHTPPPPRPLPFAYSDRGPPRTVRLL